MVERYEREWRHVSGMVTSLAVLLEERFDVAMKLDAAVLDNRSVGGFQRAADRGRLLERDGPTSHDGGDRIGEIGGVGLRLADEPTRVLVVD